MSSTFSDDAKRERALTTLTYFHNRAINYPANYHFNSPQELVDSIEAFAPGFSKLFGQAVGYATDLSEIEIAGAIANLADRVEGRAPVRPTELTAFYDALSDKLQNWDFSHWGSVIATSTVEAAGQVGTLALGGVALYALAALAVLYVSRGRA